MKKLKYLKELNFVIILMLAFVTIGCQSPTNQSPASSAPNAPVGITVSPSNMQMTIQWTSLQGLTYNLYWGTSNPVTANQGTEIGGVSSSYTLTGLSNGTTYYVALVAVDGNGSSGISATASGVPLAGVTYTLNSSGSGYTVVGANSSTLTSFTVPDAYNGLPVTEIGSSAFQGLTSLTAITLPNSISSIDTNAFYGCSGYTAPLVFPSSLTTIGDEAYYGCSSLQGSLNFPASLSSIGLSAFQGDVSLTGTLTFPATLATIGNAAFYDCSGLTGTLILPNALTALADYSFQNCSKLTGSLNIPIGVVSIGNGTFESDVGFTGSLNLISLTGLTSIGDYSFSSCVGLTETLSLPASVQTIGKSAFYGTSFTTVTINASSPPAMGNSTVFPSSVTSISVPTSSITNYKNAYGWSNYSSMMVGH